MNIMQISFTPFINSAGGTEKVFCNLANFFCKTNDVVNVFCEGKKGEPFYCLDSRVKLIDLLDEELKYDLAVKVKHEILRLLKQSGVRNDMLPKMKLKFHIIREKLKRVIEQYSPDVIICYQSYILPLLASIGYPLENVIVMFHIFPILRDLTCEERKLLKEVRCLQVLTEGAKEILVKAGYDKVIVIGNALDKPFYEVENLIPEKRDKIIACVARLDKKQKRQHLLVKAFAKIANEYDDWKLYLYGGNSTPRDYEQYLKKMIDDNGLKNKVFMLGISKDVQRDISNCSIFVMPSAFEGFGITILEAMQLGIPCIGYKSTLAVNEIIVNNGNGLLCGDGVAPLAESMEKLICDVQLRSNLSRTALETAKKYEADKIYEKWECLLYKYNNIQSL